MKDKTTLNFESDVCGEWGNFIFKIADPNDKEEVGKILEHLRHTYYKDEPCHKYLGWCEVKASDLDLVTKTMLTHELSLVAIDKTTNEVAGIRVAVDGKRRLDSSKLPLKSPHMYKIFKLKDVLNVRAKESPFWNDFDTGDNFVSAVIASVDPKYRGQGLMSEMASRNLNLLRLKEFPVIRSFFSSPITRKIAWGLGYKELARVYFEELVGFDGLGIPDFGQTESGDFANIMAFKIE